MVQKSKKKSKKELLLNIWEKSIKNMRKTLRHHLSQLSSHMEMDLLALLKKVKILKPLMMTIVLIWLKNHQQTLFILVDHKLSLKNLSWIRLMIFGSFMTLIYLESLINNRQRDLFKILSNSLDRMTNSQMMHSLRCLSHLIKIIPEMLKRKKCSTSSNILWLDST